VIIEHWAVTFLLVTVALLAPHVAREQAFMVARRSAWLGVLLGFIALLKNTVVVYWGGR
jgi:hypothetical protein